MSFRTVILKAIFLAAEAEAAQVTVEHVTHPIPEEALVDNQMVNG